MCDSCLSSTTFCIAFCTMPTIEEKSHLRIALHATQACSHVGLVMVCTVKFTVKAAQPFNGGAKVGVPISQISKCYLLCKCQHSDLNPIQAASQFQDHKSVLVRLLPIKSPKTYRNSLYAHTFYVRCPQATNHPLAIYGQTLSAARLTMNVISSTTTSNMA